MVRVRVRVRLEMPLRLTSYLIPSRVEARRE